MGSVGVAFEGSDVRNFHMAFYDNHPEPNWSYLRAKKSVSLVSFIPCISATRVCCPNEPNIPSSLQANGKSSLKRCRHIS